jgi:uncharacterized protein YndB with AHSA1/START domain
VTGKDATSFEHSVTYFASTAAVYKALTDPFELSRLMRDKALSDAKVGGKFSYMDGLISGEYAALTPNESISMHWRMKDWPDQCYSSVVITLTAEGTGICELHLKQIGIPTLDKFGNRGTDDATKNGWKERILVIGLSKIIGFGIRSD